MRNSLLFILASVALSGCVSTISYEAVDVISGLISMMVGLLFFYAGKKLSVKTSLEKWSMKLIIAGIIIFLLG